MKDVYIQILNVFSTISGNLVNQISVLQWLCSLVDSLSVLHHCHMVLDSVVNFILFVRLMCMKKLWNVNYWIFPTNMVASLLKFLKKTQLKLPAFSVID